MDKITTFEEAIDVVLKELKDLLILKNKSYGHKNITDFGKLGVLVRVNDKISRLKNLHQKKRKNPLEDEKIVDTWRDVGCYAVIWLLLDKGIFELPLKED